MSFVKHFLVFIIYSCDTSRCVQNESYLLRYRSLHSCAGEVLEPESVSLTVSSANKKLRMRSD